MMITIGVGIACFLLGIGVTLVYLVVFARTLEEHNEKFYRDLERSVNSERG